MARTAYKYRYSDSDLEVAVAASRTVADVMRILGVRWSGGSHNHISRRIKKAGLDTSHFTGAGCNAGKASPQRRHWSEVLVNREGGERREQASRLRRCLLDSGREYACRDCGNDGTWEGRPLTLEVDHENGNWLDDRPENLSFRCPNCHAQRTKSEIDKAKADRRLIADRCIDCDRKVHRASKRCMNCAAAERSRVKGAA